MDFRVYGAAGAEVKISLSFIIRREQVGHFSIKLTARKAMLERVVSCAFKDSASRATRQTYS